jgi:hypothetical protein
MAVRGRVARTIPSANAPTADLHIYRPEGTAGVPRPVILWVIGVGFSMCSGQGMAALQMVSSEAIRLTRKGLLAVPRGGPTSDQEPPRLTPADSWKLAHLVAALEPTALRVSNRRAAR